ncbi:MAG: nuclear transport factor 2 family protein [Gemmatimonadota bacterium]
MRLLQLLSLLTLLLPAATTASAQAAPSADEAAVRTVVTAYLHGLKFNDVPSLKRAFYPEARLFFRTKDGHLGQLSQEDWYKGFVTVAGQEEKGDLRIASLEITRDIATVKVIEDYPTSRYTDYIVLVQFDGGWQIVSKVYTAEKR